MAEDVVANLEAKVTADITVFDTRMKEVETKVDDLQEKTGKLGDETKKTSGSMKDTGTKLALLTAGITILYNKVKDQSGALKFLTETAKGFVQAGVDEFLTSLITAFKQTNDSVQENADATTAAIPALSSYADRVHLVTLADGDLRWVADEASEGARTLAAALNEGKAYMDEFGNAVVDLNNERLVFEKASGKFIGHLSTQDGMLKSLNDDTMVAHHIIDEVAAEWGINADQFMTYMESSSEAMDKAWGSTENVKGFFGDMASAAWEAKHRIDELLISMNINPITGTRFTDVEMYFIQQRFKRITGLDYSAHNFAIYLEQGAGG